MQWRRFNDLRFKPVIIFASINIPPPEPTTFEERWNGSDRGLLCSWFAGIEKGRMDPALVAQARAGELPVLPFWGGVERVIKGKKKGVWNYVAMWQGLRGEHLDIDTNKPLTLICSRTGMPVVFSWDIGISSSESA